MSTSDNWSAVRAELDELLAAEDVALPADVLQKMFTVAVRQYSRTYEQDATIAPLKRNHVNATDVANCVLEMLRVVDLELFELTLWGSRLANVSGGPHD